MTYTLVVDVLDKCNNDRDIRMILQLFTNARLLKAAQLQVFLMSRPKVPIWYWFSQVLDTEHKYLIFHDILWSIVDHNIYIFVEESLKTIAHKHSLHAEWPGKDVIRHIVQTACRLFIWAATACKFICEGRKFATKRLDVILKGSRSNVTIPERHLDKIYVTVLEHSISPVYTDEEKQEAYWMLRQILRIIAILSLLLSISSLERLLSLAKEDIYQMLKDLYSILDIPNDENQPLRLYHLSFQDFLLNKDRSKNSKF